MKKTKLYAAAILALLAGVFSACKEEPKPNTETPEPTKVEMNHVNSIVYTKNGASAFTEFERYDYVFRNAEETEAYAIMFNSLANELKGAGNGTYALTGMLEKSEEAVFQKSTKENPTASITAQSGNVVVKNTSEGVDITVTATWADGEKVIYHYAGKPTVEQVDINGRGEPTEKSELTLKADTLLFASDYGFTNSGVGSTFCPLYALSVDQPEDKTVQAVLFFSMPGEDKTALEEGEYEIKLPTSMTMDDYQNKKIVFGGNADLYSQIAQGAPVSYIGYGIDGQNVASTYWPQTGKVTVSKTGEKYKIEAKDVKTYYGSTIQLTVESAIAPLEDEDEDAAAAPARLAPRAVKEYGKSFVR